MLSYWYQKAGGPVFNDCICVGAQAAKPVIAHRFLNDLLDLPVVLNNISWNGYMQPLTGVTPQVLVKEEILPPSLTSTLTPLGM